jgi:hypothetical protein
MMADATGVYSSTLSWYRRYTNTLSQFAGVIPVKAGIQIRDSVAGVTGSLFSRGWHARCFEEERSFP